MPTRTFYSFDNYPSPPIRQNQNMVGGILSVLSIRAKITSLLPRDSLKTSDSADSKQIKTTSKFNFDIQKFLAKFRKPSKPAQVNIFSPSPTPKFEKVDQVDAHMMESMIYHTTSMVEQKYKKLVIGLLSLFVMLIALNLYTVFYLSFSNKNTPVSVTEAQNIAPNLQQIKSPQTGLRIVRDFAGNSALGDVGFQLEIQKNLIKTKGSQNCKTSILPPMENGCHFLLIPGSLGIPSKGMLYQSVGIDGDLAEGDKIQIDIKNYDKETLQTIATITSANITQDFKLPENIPSSSGILFRLWAKNQDITIRQINLKYFSVDDLKQVSGTLKGDLAKLDETPKVYQDSDQNGKFDGNTDKAWLCRPNFPGAKFVLGQGEKFNLEPDDGCFTDVKPDCWYKAKTNKCVLPSGKWLLVWEDKQIEIPFEVKGDNDTLSLGL
jgi:hypothetical protein